MQKYQKLRSEFLIMTGSSTLKGMEDQFKIIKPSKPPGPDDIFQQMLKNIIPSINVPQAKWFNASITNKQFSNIWTPSTIVPLYKNKRSFEES